MTSEINLMLNINKFDYSYVTLLHFYTEKDPQQVFAIAFPASLSHNDQACSKSLKTLAFLNKLTNS